MSKPIPVGLDNLAAVAKPPSPEKPDFPVPTIVVTIPVAISIFLTLFEPRST